MRKVIVFSAEREGYSIDQIFDKATTIEELIAFLEDFDPDTRIVLSHDNGYTYGGLRDCGTYCEETEAGLFEEM